MSRRKKSGNALSFTLSAQPPDDLRHRLQRCQKLNVCQSSSKRLLDKKDIHRCCRFKADRRKHASGTRILFGDIQNFHWRIYHPDTSSCRLSACKAYVRAANPQKIPECKDRRIFFKRQFHQTVNIRSYRHADRAPGAGNQMNPFR